MPADWVFSHGVLHHTPDTQKAINEVYRVLKPGGRAIVMLYHKKSFNYFVRIMGYMRARALLKILSRTGRWNTDRQALRQQLLGLRGNQDRRVWDAHYHNFLRTGWSYLRAKISCITALMARSVRLHLPLAKESAQAVLRVLRRAHDGCPLSARKALEGYTSRA